MPDIATQIEISPRCSLSPRGARLFFASACVASFGAAGLVAAQGFWPVLPFAGLEMLLLAWALKGSMDRRFHRQTITVTEEQVQIVEELPQRPRAEVLFSRHWSQVRIRAGVSPLHPSRLTIESSGRRYEIAQFLNEPERLGLAQRLRVLIGRVAQSPQLGAENLG